VHRGAGRELGRSLARLEIETVEQDPHAEHNDPLELSERGFRHRDRA
jgi:hypothetical protein